ncbi:MAG TPA: HlyD family secretion protein [Candidatus Rokubacteria bacterium]|nr:HlyD family secretion protein [Candidatus Rokubacteria bacterium]
MKRALSLLVVGVLAGAAVWGYLYTQSGGSGPRYRLARVERGPLTAAVSATGNLNAVITVQVGSQVSGQIKELLADFNSVVKNGQVIARIDQDIFRAKVDQASAELDAARASVLNQQAQVERARADVENARAALAEAKAQTAKAQVTVLDARRDRDRKAELFARQLIARSDMDSAQANHDSSAAQLESVRAREQALASAINSSLAQLRVADAGLASARATVEQRRASLEQARVDLDRTTIRAPVDGVVVSRQVDVGQTVAASLQAPVLFTIAQDLTKMQVETSVDEADIGRIRLDDRATFTVDAFPGETFSGTVVQIRKAAQIVQNVVTYIVVVAVGNPSGRLLPGMTANVKLVVAEKPSVLKVPNAALRFRPAGAETPAAGAPPAAPGRAGAPPSTESTRERLVQGLKLTEEQQRRLDPILQDTRQQLMELQSQGLPEAARHARAQKIREASRARIRAILTAEQQARFDESAGGGGGGAAGRVFVLGPDGKPAAVTVMLGISDGTSTEVVRGGLREGQEVVVGAAAGGSGRPAAGGPRLRL